MTDKRFQCAELVDLTWSAALNEQHQEFAILAEIWTTGAVFLVDEPVRRGTEILVSLPHGIVRATVRTCREERCSWTLEVDVEQTGDWFGGRYEPAVLVLGEILQQRPRMGPRLVSTANPVASMLRTTLRRPGSVQIQPRAS